MKKRYCVAAVEGAHGRAVGFGWRTLGLVGGMVLGGGVVWGQDVPESVYAPPGVVAEGEKVNEGGVRLEMRGDYVTDYVFRGIEPLEVRGGEDRPNFQFDGRVTFDLGKVKPFVGGFVNVGTGDPESDLQEVRPYGGVDWELKPLTLTGGHATYLFPDRGRMDTNEVFAQVKFDDSVLYRSDKPLLSPYGFVAYDYDRYTGEYFQLGVSHDFVVGETGLIVTADAHVAYVLDHNEFTLRNGDDTGFQHWQVGLTGRYGLNTLLNVGKRYGEWTLIGYLNYTDGIDHDLRSVSEVWGGAGIGFKY